MKTLIVSLLITLTICNISSAQSPKPDGIAGVWLTQDGNMKIKIVPSAGTYQGTVIWMKEPDENGKPKLDRFNPDPAKRSNPIIGKTLLVYDLKFDGDDAWKDGTIYDSRNGKAYGCTITMKNDNMLKVRGYLGVSLLGQTNEWKRVN